MKSILGIIIAIACFTASRAWADTNNLSQLSRANNRFALDLLQQIAPAQPGQNIFLSPYSLSSALQMLAVGARGKTRDEILHVLKTGKIPPQLVNDAYQESDRLLRSQTNVDLALANGIWVDKGMQLKPPFLATNEEFFQAQLANVDFETPEAADTINSWAAKNTGGKIKDIVAFPFPAKTELILANAIYFYGKWATPFDQSLTQKRIFHLANGMMKQAPMMSQRQKFRYEAGDDFQAVELPYAGRHLHMTLVLPVTNSSPVKLLLEFAGKNWNWEILQGLSNRVGTVILPKFKINYNILLNDPLESLGMKRAFIQGSADFSGIDDDPLFVSQVKQKSFVDVNEEGTEAAAVTTVTIRSMVAIRPPPPFEMVLDRPFIFVISDNSTGMILFLGIVNDPTV